MSTEQRNAFQEVNESYTMAEAIAEAQRCLHCKVPQCKKGCPISNDIPDWIHELKGQSGQCHQHHPYQEQLAGCLWSCVCP